MVDVIKPKRRKILLAAVQPLEFSLGMTETFRPAGATTPDPPHLDLCVGGAGPGL